MKILCILPLNNNQIKNITKQLSNGIHFLTNNEIHNGEHENNHGGNEQRRLQIITHNNFKITILIPKIITLKLYLQFLV